MEQTRFVYVLRSETDPARHYVGATSDVRERIAHHNAGESPHTSKYRPWHLVVAIEFSTQKLALRFERYLKSGSGRAFAKRHFA
jgi:putative endonuclease